MQQIMKVFMIMVVEIMVVFLDYSFVMAQHMPQPPYSTTKQRDCGTSYGAPKGRVGLRRVADPEGGWQTRGFILDSFGPMPQTAYDPNFGCYPGNARTTHRYPAFHGTYYADPTNYRHYAEYPWNADLVEPQAYPNNWQPAMGSNVQICPTDAPVNAPMYAPAQNVELTPAQNEGITSEQNEGFTSEQNEEPVSASNEELTSARNEEFAPVASEQDSEVESVLEP